VQDYVAGCDPFAIGLVEAFTKLRLGLAAERLAAGKSA
jgi:hypothetical protein